MASTPDALPAPTPSREPSQPGDMRGLIPTGEGRPPQDNSISSRQLILIDTMIAWSIANPGKPWNQCAPQIGVSVMWCRMVAGSDAFKARYAEQKDIVLRELGVMGLKEKISAAAEIAVERLAEKAAVSESMSDLTDASEVLFGALFGKDRGGAVAPSPTTVNVQTQVILEGRQHLLEGRGSASPPPIEVSDERKPS